MPRIQRLGIAAIMTAAMLVGGAAALVGGRGTGTRRGRGLELRSRPFGEGFAPSRPRRVH